MTGKVCKCGKEIKSLHRIYCSNKCMNKYNPSRTWDEKQRNYKYRTNYGITLEDYNELFTLQNGCCAICKRHQSEFVKKLHVDHCHKTNVIRGLLCHNCNLALGRFRDDPEVLQAALEYLA